MTDRIYENWPLQYKPLKSTSAAQNIVNEPNNIFYFNLHSFLYIL